MQCIHLSAVQMSDVKPFTITRIYADKDGSTKLGAFNIKMKGSGKSRLVYTSYMYKCSDIPVAGGFRPIHRVITLCSIYTAYYA